MSPGEEKFVDTRLTELREAMRGLEAPASVERVALAAFRQGVPERRRGWAWAKWAVAVAALVVVAVAMSMLRDLQTGEVAPPQPLVARVEVPQVPEARRVEPKRPKPQVLAARRPKPAPVRPVEVATEFIPLPYAPPMAESDAVRVIRVGLPRQAMRAFGLPVAPDRAGGRIPADVLLGEDGVARAVRFVKTSR